jgi:zinc and cadmium transporter
MPAGKEISMVWVYALASVAIVSLISLVGVFTLMLSTKKLESYLLLLVSFSAGALLGDAFLHLLPETFERFGFGIWISVYVLLGILVSFSVEKFIHWRHCHIPSSTTHVHSFAYMNLFGDSIHNFIDGLVIGASYLASIPVGIATTLAVVFHEIPQEMGDMGVLIHGGFARKRALLLNFVTALTAVAGSVIALLLGTSEGSLQFLLPFAAGGFIYIAAADLIPEIHKECDTKKSLAHMVTIVLGMAVMFLLLLIG